MSDDAAVRRLVRIAQPESAPVGPADQDPLAKLACVGIGGGTELAWEPLPGPGVLVLASACDKRGPCRLELLSSSPDWRCELDVGFCSLGQRFHVAVPAGVGGLHVRALDDDGVFWAIADADRLPGGLPAVWPAEDGADRVARFWRRLEHDGVAEFGWMGGCVLEAFDALHRVSGDPRWPAARDRWLSHFLDDAHVAYQDPRGRPRRDTFVTIEATLPIASITRARPEHPVVDMALDFLHASAGRDATCEGCYTVAYPVMQAAVARGRAALADLALAELRHRRDKLHHEGAIYLRHHGTHRTYRNWARGVAWYLLGHVECLKLARLAGETLGAGRWGEAAVHVGDLVPWVLAEQRDDGRWGNFFDDAPALPADNAGSAGIAAALVGAATLGLADAEVAAAAAGRCWSAVIGDLHVDGWPGNVSPSNKRGEEFQRGPRRTSETFGLGLVGQLAAAVWPASRRV